MHPGSPTIGCNLTLRFAVLGSCIYIKEMEITVLECIVQGNLGMIFL